jgi:mutator protein MutT
LSCDTVHVVAGALIGSDDRVLIAQRPLGKHLAGGWEFPGGKLDPGEDREAGLRRELREEIGITVLRCRPLIRLRHAYPDRKVLLDVWLIDRFVGHPASLDGQSLRWCTRDQLLEADLLPADRPVITALRLPPTIESAAAGNYDLVPSRSFRPRTSLAEPARLLGALCESTTHALAAAAAGADFVAMDREAPAAQIAACCERIGRPFYARGICLREAWDLGATGVNRA